MSAPSLAATLRTTYIVGNTRRLSDTSHATPLARMVDRDGVAVTLPDAAVQGIRPRLGAAGDTLYLLWGEAVGVQVPHSAPTVGSVWFASRLPNGTWSAPQRLIQTEEVYWDVDDASGFLTTPQGSQQLAFSARKSAYDGEVVVVTVRGGRADVAHVPVAGGAVYTDLAWTDRGGLLAFIAADPNSRDQNSVFVATWQPERGTWSAPVLVSKSGEQPAYDTRAIAIGDTIHVFWLQTLAAPRDERVLRHVETHDLGASWSASQDLSSNGVGGFRVSTVGGSIAVWYEATRAGRTQTFFTCWQARWSPPVPVGGARSIAEMRRLPSASGPEFIAIQRDSAGTPARTVFVRAP